MTRTLADYRPQHDEDCQSRICGECKQLRVEFTHRNGCRADAYQDCDCGLSALLGVPRAGQVEDSKEENALSRPDHPRVNPPLTIATTTEPRTLQDEELASELRRVALAIRASTDLDAESKAILYRRLPELYL